MRIQLSATGAGSGISDDAAAGLTACQAVGPTACQAAGTVPGMAGDNADLAAAFVLRLVANATATRERDLLSACRGNPRTARARQMAIYFMHTWLAVGYREIGAWFGRDRTTIAHACRRIENLRDEPGIAEIVAELERLFAMLGLIAPCLRTGPDGAGGGAAAGGGGRHA